MVGFLDYGFRFRILQKIRCLLMSLSRPATLIMTQHLRKCLYRGLRITLPWWPDTHRAAGSPLPFSPSPFLPPTITKLSSSSMKHLFLFLFDMGDSIKASGSKRCNTRLLLRRQRMLLSAVVKEKNSLHFSLFFLSLSPEVLNKQDLYPWPRNASKSTCLLGLAVKCRAVLAA